MNYVKLVAPAKINLVLAVGQKQPDGYHKVDTIMHALALHDTITMRRFDEEEGGLSIHLATESTEGVELALPPEDNLVHQAVTALAQATNRTANERIDITLTKAIPTQAGLGGGSSDAAAALLGAATLWDMDPHDLRIAEVAQTLGADVPFFLTGGCAYLINRGDEVEHTLEPAKNFVTLIRPEGGVSTPAAYAAFDENPTFATADELKKFQEATAAKQLTCFNNLTQAAQTVLPELGALYDWAQAQIVEGKAVDGVLCGSGAAYALLADNYDAAVAVSIAAKKQGWATRVTSLASVGASIVEAY